MVEYGLVGLDCQSSMSETLRVEVGYSTSEGVMWDKSLAVTIDDVRLGLPEEYSQAILQALSSAVATKLSPGVLRLAEAAHGAVGSSPSFFAKLSFAAVELMFLDVSDAPDELLAKLLRRILVG
ncbi:hypothetical protein BE04_28615 [Sorangium cellulosum]|uniref:Uncharacterized protein n=1 Tax=Sorangium cellulosum TaxID=56 RepID=A0A150PEU9_SORCE|nr:hypothetical protein BE04_28615 [Sorangium cellulosum]